MRAKGAYVEPIMDEGRGGREKRKERKKGEGGRYTHVGISSTYSSGIQQWGNTFL